MLVAFPFFVFAAWHSGRSSATPLTNGDKWKILGLGLTGYYLASYLDFLGLELISPTLERLILYLNPTLVMLIGLVLFRRSVAARQLLALSISYLGIVFAFWADLSVSGRNVILGSVWVFLSALAYAIYLVGSGEMVRRVGPIRLTAYASCVACLACVAQFCILRPITALSYPPGVYWLSLLNGSLCTVLPVFAVMLAIRRIGAARAAQVGLIGPVSTIAMSALILGERMGIGQVVGTVFVMGGVYIVSRQAPTGEKA
jgi:drug/metabolite transporter (DMT)-like permease